ncbi:MAG: ABC transporter ATP-binding protein [Deltaproteobacteria bacterium]|nr:ABC transporter ATP-binding protein [Deltaproteobacteria bacterium]
MAAAAITLEQVKKNFGAVQALRGVSLEIPEKTVFGLIGPNGAGKTTLFSLLLGYLEPSEGSLRVLGVKPSELHTLRGQVAALPQDSDLPPTITITQALTYFGSLCGLSGAALNKDIDRVLELVDLKEWRRAKIRQLSHGMKKRVGIAQTLIGEPKLIILDEPTSGLDPKHAYHLIQLFKAITDKTTVLISSHNLAELEHLCDSAVILVRGGIVRSGSMNDIRRADVEVRVTLGQGKEPNLSVLSGALGDARLDYVADTRLLTLRFEENAGKSSDEQTTKALSAMIADGLTIRSVERGQSLLTTYLELAGGPMPTAAPVAAPAPMAKI